LHPVLQQSVDFLSQVFYTQRLFLFCCCFCFLLTVCFHRFHVLDFLKGRNLFFHFFFFQSLLQCTTPPLHFFFYPDVPFFCPELPPQKCFLFLPPCATGLPHKFPRFLTLLFFFISPRGNFGPGSVFCSTRCLRFSIFSPTSRLDYLLSKTQLLEDPKNAFCLKLCASKTDFCPLSPSRALIPHLVLRPFCFMTPSPPAPA